MYITVTGPKLKNDKAEGEEAEREEAVSFYYLEVLIHINMI
jgi:hypothetical protein